MNYAPTPMHIPDGFLSLAVSIFFWIFSLIIIGFALRRVSRDLNEHDVPLMGVMAAAIFAGQMLNFAVTGGTSGHLLGAALAAILLGPWTAILTMTAVVATQALIFQDGGLLALGANLFNMAILGVTVAYAVDRIVLKLSNQQKWGVFAGGFLAAWSSIFVAALSCALQLSLSNTSPANIAIPAMAGIHALIGIGEGLITLGALAFIYAVRRDLLKLGQPQPNGSQWVLGTGVLISIGLAVLSPLASTHPDGLEWVAEEHGFIEAAQGSMYNLIPDYVMPGIENETLATITAGIIGILIVLGVTLGLAYARRRKSQPADETL